MITKRRVIVAVAIVILLAAAFALGYVTRPERKGTSTPWTEQMKAWASAATALAAVAGAVIGALWSYFRYHREEPHLPRVNVTIDASLSSTDRADYITFDATVTHVSGGAVKIHQGNDGDEDAPKIELRQLTNATSTGILPATEAHTYPVLRHDKSLASGESIHDEGIVAVTDRSADSVGYEVRLTFTAHWIEKVDTPWTWSPNKILLVHATPPAQPTPTSLS